MSYPITDIDGIDGEVAAVLKSAGIRSTDRLLEAARTVKGRKILAEKTGYDEKRLLYWANIADRMRIKGVRKEYAELLQAAGVDTVKELKYRNPVQPGQGDGRRQQEAQARPASAIGESREAVDRKRQDITAEDHVLAVCGLLDSPSPTAQSDRHGKRPYPR